MNVFYTLMTNNYLFSIIFKKNIWLYPTNSSLERAHISPVTYIKLTYITLLCTCINICQQFTRYRIFSLLISQTLMTTGRIACTWHGGRLISWQDTPDLLS